MGIFDDKKTLLEERWESEEVGESETNPYVEGPLKEDVEVELKDDDLYEEYQTAEEESVFMTSPVCEEGVPLVLITNNNRIFIGGLLEVLEQGVVLDHPMVYVEIPDQRNPGRLQLGVQKVFHGLGVPQNMWFKHDALNMIRKDSAGSVRLAAMYLDTLKEAKSADAGVKAPSVSEIRDFARKER